MNKNQRECISGICDVQDISSMKDWYLKFILINHTNKLKRQKSNKVFKWYEEGFYRRNNE